MYDVAIIGKGPAGISAAINAKARNKSVIIFGRDSKKVMLSPSIHNYPGFIEIKGPELIEKLNNHLQTLDVHTSSKMVNMIYTMDGYFSIQAETDMIEAKTVILSVGVDFKKSIENEDKFLGSGVSYCATCDAPLYKGKVVGVVGYNKESIEETKFLSEVCKKVYFVPAVNEDFDFSNNVEIIKDVPLKFEGDFTAKKLLLKNSEVEADGFFVIKDSYPLGTLVPGLEVDGAHVKVNKNMETNIKGLYAAGDITGKPYQIAKAVGEGQLAALYAADYIDNLG
ncbi:thioredoxin reductase (NADPH) [Caloramator quimbayensis]|uniref:Thioredoxin reductase (NADPH) n=1 Tax=Caloramator quimbayensis TaxID=1147123 RepID=A0A1T4XP00_9CLOT|nr:NAD(P)/FAD-dependent oxidoreductase [Caloramator quimbayensis]SKA91284.1 thioredoxin reductase (NADPH) [Caloramator quimbayensis]